MKIFVLSAAVLLISACTQAPRPFAGAGVESRHGSGVGISNESGSTQVYGSVGASVGVSSGGSVNVQY